MRSSLTNLLSKAASSSALLNAAGAAAAPPQNGRPSLQNSIYSAIERLGRVSENIPFKIRTLLGAVTTIDEDVQHLLTVSFFALPGYQPFSLLLVLCYADGMQIIDCSVPFERTLSYSRPATILPSEPGDDTSGIHGGRTETREGERNISNTDAPAVDKAPANHEEENRVDAESVQRPTSTNSDVAASPSCELHEVFSCSVTEGVAHATLIRQSFGLSMSYTTSVSSCPGPEAAGGDGAALRTVTTTENAAEPGSSERQVGPPLVALVLMANLHELRLINAVTGALVHRLEMAAPVTALYSASAADGGEQAIKGILAVCGHRNIRLIDAEDFSLMATLRVAPSPNRPCIALQGRYMWYESPRCPSELVCFDWVAGRHVRRFFVDFDMALHCQPRSAPSSADAAEARGCVNAAAMWLDCGGYLSPRETTEDDLVLGGCYAYEDSGGLDEDDLTAVLQRKSSLGGICVADERVALVDAACSALCVFKISQLVEAPFLRLSLLAAVQIPEPALATSAPLAYITSTLGNYKSNEAATACSSVTLRYRPSEQDTLIALGTASGVCHLFAYSEWDGPERRPAGIRKLYSFHLGNPSIPEIFWPTMHFARDGSALIAASLSGFMHVIPMAESVPLTGAGAGSQRSILELPERIFRSVSVAGESTRVCRQRHHHRDRLWTTSFGPTTSVGGGLIKKIRLLK